MMANKHSIQDLQRTIGLRIKEFRNVAGLTQEQLSEEIDIAPQYLSRLETGRCVPSLDTIVGLAEALNVAPQALLSEPRKDRQAERMERVAAMFDTLTESDAAFLESELAGWLSHLKKRSQ